MSEISRTPETDEQDLLREIEDLLTGTGRDDFEAFESELHYFCPFEATGMARREIKHAHFLAYLFDPNNPHPFGDAFIRWVLTHLTSAPASTSTSLRPLDIHFLSATQARVYRERWNIDILIEIPAGCMGHSPRGVVICIEMKIDAPESRHQLKTYETRIRREYPERDWDHFFVFMTPDGRPPSKENASTWCAISLPELVDTFERAVCGRERGDGYGADPALRYFLDYAKLIRRHFMPNERLEQLAARIWARHGRALAKLFEYKPNLQLDLLDHVCDSFETWSRDVKEKTGLTLRQDTHSKRIRRFCVDDWLEIPGFKSTGLGWVDSGSLLVIELSGYDNANLTASFVLGPGDEALKGLIYREALACDEIKVRGKTRQTKTYNHLNDKSIISKEEMSPETDIEIDVESLQASATKEMQNFVVQFLPTFDGLVRKAAAQIQAGHKR